MQPSPHDAPHTLAPYHPPQAPENTSNVIFRQSALNALRHWWMVALPIGAVLAAVAAGTAYTLHVPQYEANATLLITPKEHIVFPEGRAAFSDRFVRTQQELVRSTLVIGPVVSREEIATLPEVSKLRDPIEMLAMKVNLRSRGNSDFYDLTYTGPEPKNAAEIVNAIAESYFKMVDEHEAQRDSRLISLLETERDAHAGKVTRLREDVRELSKEALGKDPFLPEAAVEAATADPLVILRSKLTQTAVDEAMLRAELAMLQQLDAAHEVTVADDEVNELVESHQAMESIKAQIEQKQQLMRGIATASRLGEKDPKYLEKQAEIQRDQELLEKTKADLQITLRQELLTGRVSARKDELDRKDAALKSAVVMRGILEEKVKSEVVDKKQLKGNLLELEFKRDELTRASTVFERINDRIVALQTEQRAPRQVVMLEEARAPLNPVEQYPLKMMAAAGGAAFLLPLLLAFGWEWRMQRLSDAQQLTAFSRVPVVAEIASFPSGARSHRRVVSRRVSRALRHFEESVHSLRTYLVLSEPLTGMKVLAVTSSISQEGKTSVATQLALSYSKSTGRVLLIDGDMRSPDVHRIFDMERGQGLADVLQGELPLRDAINREWSEDIHVLPAGQLSSDPHRLVASGAFERLLDELREEYTTIIIDTPPVLAASESLVMARAADAALLCTMRDVSRLAQVRTTYKRLVEAGAHPVGAVFSGVPMARYYYSYGDYDYTRD